MTKTVAVDWRPVAYFPYEVSEDGRVRRTAGGSNNAKPGRVLKGYIDRDGYTVVRLSRGGLVYDRKVHRLVCEAFHGSQESSEVRHLDGNPSNNHASNLTWGTASENAADRARHGRTPHGEESVRAKLTNAQAAEIRDAYTRIKQERSRQDKHRIPRGWVQRKAREYGVSYNTLSSILDGKGY